MKKWAKNKVADLRWAVQVLLIFGLVVPIAVLGVAGYAVPVPPLGELRTRVIIHPPNCEFISPEILCPEPRSVHKLLEPKMILQTQLNLTLPHLFSTEQGFFRSFTIFSTHFLPRAVCTDPGPLPRCPVRTPFEMQAFKLHFPLNEFLFIRETLVFSNRLVVLDNELAPLQEFGSLFSPTVFRKNRLEFEFGFGGFILVADLLTDNRNCLEPSVIPQNPTFPLPIVCTVMSPDVVHIPQLAHGLKFIFILPFPGILISDLQIFINADEGLEYVGTGTQPEELFPEAVIRPNSGLQKIALTIRNLTIAGVTFKITAFTKANEFGGIAINAEGKLQPIDFVAKVTFATKPGMGLIYDKALLDGKWEISEELTLELLLSDSTQPNRFPPFQPIAGGDGEIDSRALIFTWTREDFSFALGITLSGDTIGTQSITDFTKAIVPEGSEIAAEDIDFLYEIVLGFHTEYGDPIVGPCDRRGEPDCVIAGADLTKFDSIALIATQKFFTFTPPIRLTFVAAFGPGGGGGAVDVNIEF